MGKYLQKVILKIRKGCVFLSQNPEVTRVFELAGIQFRQGVPEPEPKPEPEPESAKSSGRNQFRLFTKFTMLVFNFVVNRFLVKFKISITRAFVITLVTKLVLDPGLNHFLVLSKIIH